MNLSYIINIFFAYFQALNILNLIYHNNLYLKIDKYILFF